MNQVIVAQNLFLPPKKKKKNQNSNNHSNNTWPLELERHLPF